MFASVKFKFNKEMFSYLTDIIFKYRQICPPKPGIYTETSISVERNIRYNDLCLCKCNCSNGKIYFISTLQKYETIIKDKINFSDGFNIVDNKCLYFNPELYIKQITKMS